VRDDVVRQTGEDHLPRQVFAGRVLARAKVAEQDGAQLRVIEGVAAAKGVRHEAQPAPACLVFAGARDHRIDRIDAQLPILRSRISR